MRKAFIEYLLVAWRALSHFYWVIAVTEVVCQCTPSFFSRQGHRTPQTCTHLHAGVAHSVTLPAFGGICFCTARCPVGQGEAQWVTCQCYRCYALGRGTCLKERVSRRQKTSQNPLLHSLSLPTAYMSNSRIRNMGSE